MLERDSAALGRAPAPRSGCCAAGSRRRTSRRRPAHRRARRARAQRAAVARLARARRGPRRRARASCCTCTTTGSCARSAPASRAGADCTRCHGRDTLPGRAAQLPRRLARGVGRLRRGARAVAAADRGRAPTRSSSRARSRCAGSSSSARRSAAARARSRRCSARSRSARAPPPGRCQPVFDRSARHVEPGVGQPRYRRPWGARSCAPPRASGRTRPAGCARWLSHPRRSHWRFCRDRHEQLPRSIRPHCSREQHVLFARVHVDEQQGRRKISANADQRQAPRRAGVLSSRLHGAASVD